MCEYTDLQANLAPGSEHTYSIYIHGSTTDLQRRQGSILPHRGPPYERPGLSIWLSCEAGMVPLQTCGTQLGICFFSCWTLQTLIHRAEQHFIWGCACGTWRRSIGWPDRVLWCRSIGCPTECTDMWLHAPISWWLLTIIFDWLCSIASIIADPKLYSLRVCVWAALWFKIQNYYLLLRYAFVG